MQTLTLIYFDALNLLYELCDWWGGGGGGKGLFSTLLCQRERNKPRKFQNPTKQSLSIALGWSHPPTTSSHNELPLNNLLFPSSLRPSSNRNKLLPGKGNTTQDFWLCHVLLLGLLAILKIIEEYSLFLYWRRTQLLECSYKRSGLSGNKFQHDTILEID